MAQLFFYSFVVGIDHWDYPPLMGLKRKFIMGHSLMSKSLFLKPFMSMTLAIFMLSLFQPCLKVWAYDSGLFDGPGGFISDQYAMQRFNQDMNFMKWQVSEENREMGQYRKVVGMALGAAVGGGLVAMLGLAASPILAATAVLGSMAAGGFLSSGLTPETGNPFQDANRSSNFMTWAGGLAGGMLGFIIPGGSVIGATLGAAAGGWAGNYFGEKNVDKIEQRYGRLMYGGVGGLFGGAYNRFSGAFMGPTGAVAGGPESRSRLLGGSGFPWASPGWYSSGGRFFAGPGGMGMAGDGPIDNPQFQVWHDNNGELAYPGWENDLFSLDRDGRLNRTMPEWTLDGREGGPGLPGGSNVETPHWNTSGPSRSGSHTGYYRGGGSSIRPSDGEAFNSGFQPGSDENLVDVSQRYRDAVEELRNLTLQSAPALQRQRAHQEVQRFERQLQQMLKQ